MKKETSWFKKLISPIRYQFYLFYSLRRFSERMELARINRGQDLSVREDKNQSFIAAAKRLSIDYIQYENQVLELKSNGKKMFVHGYDTEDDNYPVDVLTGDKFIASKLMREQGVQTPESKSFSIDAYNEALAYFKSLKGAVVKPRHGGYGDGVTVGVETSKEFRAAFLEALVFDDSVLVEKFIQGDNIRVLVYDGKVIACEMRLPARVVGDGLSSIAKLIENVNIERIQGPNLQKLRPIVIDPTLHSYLHYQDLSMDSVPRSLEIIKLRGVCNFSKGGSIEDVAGLIHPGYVSMAIKAAEVFNAKLLGVDIISSDFNKPPTEAMASINEVNLRRDITTDMVNNKQGGMEPAEAILRTHFNVQLRGANGR